MNLRKRIKSIFGFSKVETNGFLVLVPLMIFVIFSEPIYRNYTFRQTEDFSAEKKRLDSLINRWELQTVSSRSEVKHTVIQYQLFNPNTASIPDLKGLGFSERTAMRISNYVKKGGKFSVKKDLLKIYGIDHTHFNTIKQFIDLPDSLASLRLRPSAPEKIINKPVRLDINRADTSQLKRIHGIGEKLSLRIVRYRDLLGGFVKLEQLREVYGLDSIVIQRVEEKMLIEEGFVPVMLHINHATLEELDLHPYISKSIAKAIVAYRFQHGSFLSKEDLKKLPVLSSKEYEKMVPYITID